MADTYTRPYSLGPHSPQYPYETNSSKTDKAGAPAPAPASDPPRNPTKLNSLQFAAMMADVDEELKTKKKAEENLKNRSSLYRGLLRGIDSTQATFYGGIAAMQSAVGDEEGAERNFRAYQEQMRQASENPTPVQSFFSTDEKTGAFGSINNFGEYIGSTIGAAVPSLAEAGLSAAAGSAAGGMLVPGPDPTDIVTVPVGGIAGLFSKAAVKRAISEVADQYVKKGIAKEVAQQRAEQAVKNTVAKKVGAAAGAAEITALHEGGGIYAEGREKGYDNPVSALLLGQLSGASEAVLGNVPAGLRTFIGRSAVPDVARKQGVAAAAGFLWDTAKNATEEGVQEGFQEFLNSANEEINDPKSKLFSKENFMKWAEAGAAGAVVGGVVGAGLKGVDAGREVLARRPSEPLETETKTKEPKERTPKLPPEADTSGRPDNIQSRIDLLDSIVNNVESGVIDPKSGEPQTVSRTVARQQGLIGGKDNTTDKERLSLAKQKIVSLAEGELKKPNLTDEQRKSLTDVIARHSAPGQQKTQGGTVPPVPGQVPTTSEGVENVRQQTESKGEQGIQQGREGEAQPRQDDDATNDEERKRLEEEIAAGKAEKNQPETQQQTGDTSSPVAEAVPDAKEPPDAPILSVEHKGKTYAPISWFSNDDGIQYELLKAKDGTTSLVRSVNALTDDVVSVDEYQSFNEAKEKFDDIKNKLQPSKTSTPEGIPVKVRGGRNAPAPAPAPAPTPAPAPAPAPSEVEQEATSSPPLPIPKEKRSVRKEVLPKPETTGDIVSPVLTGELTEQKSPDRNWKSDDRVFIQGHTTGSGVKIPNSVGKVRKVNADNVVVQIDGETNFRAVPKDKLQLPDATFEKGEIVGLPWAAEKKAKVTDVLPDGRYELNVAGRTVVQPADRMVKLPTTEVKAKPSGDVVSPEEAVTPKARSQEAENVPSTKEGGDLDAQVQSPREQKQAERQVAPEQEQVTGKIWSPDSLEGKEVSEIAKGDVLTTGVFHDTSQLPEEIEDAINNENILVESGFVRDGKFLTQEEAEKLAPGITGGNRSQEEGIRKRKARLEAALRVTATGQAPVAQPTPSQSPQGLESTPASSLQAKDIFTDSQGQRWLVHTSRNGVVIAHPVVNGKPQVNRDSSVPFAITEQGKIRNPDYRTDIQSVEKWTEEADSKPVAEQSVTPTVSREQVEDHFVKKQTALGASEQTVRQTAKKTYGRIWDKIRKSPWKTITSLQVKGRGGVSLGRMVRDTVIEMKKAGFLTVAWDRDGNPHYALPGTQTPDWLTETDTDAARAKLPAKPSAKDKESQPPSTPVAEQAAPSPAEVSKESAQKEEPKSETKEEPKPEAKQEPKPEAKKEGKESPAKTYLSSLDREDLQDLAKALDVAGIDKDSKKDAIADAILNKVDSQPAIKDFLEKAAAAKAKPRGKKKRQAAPRGESDADTSLLEKPEGKEIPSKDFTEDERKQEQILKKIGITLRLVEGGPDQGVPGLFIPESRTIWLDRNYSQDLDKDWKEKGRPEKAATWGLFAHEMFHAIKRSSPKAWQQLYDWVNKYDPEGLGNALIAYMADMKKVDATYYERLLKDEDLRDDEALSRYLEDRAIYLKFWNDLGKEKPGLLAKIGRWLRRVLRFAEPGATNPETLAGQTRLAIEKAMKRHKVAMKSEGGRRASPVRDDVKTPQEKRIAKLKTLARSATPDEHDALIAIGNRHSKRNFVAGDITQDRVNKLKASGLIKGKKLTSDGIDQLRQWDKSRKQALSRYAKEDGVDPNEVIYGIRVNNNPWLIAEDIITGKVDSSLIPQDLEARSDSQRNNLKRTKWDVAQWLQSLYKKATGHALSPNSNHSESAIDRMSKHLAMEALHALRQPWATRAIGWYNRKVKSALAKMANIFPEIVKKGEHQLMFKAALAISSDGQDVVPNFRMAVEIYERWKKTGTLSGFGHRSGVESSLDTMDKLVKKFGWKKVEKFLATSLTVRDLAKHKFIEEGGFDKKTFKVGGELADETVYGSMIFGAKIGSFYNNLNYRFDTITMDLWWSRTIGRLRGKLDSVNLENAHVVIDEQLIPNLSNKYLKKFNTTREKIKSSKSAALRYARSMKSHNASVFTKTAISSYVRMVKDASKAGTVRNGTIPQFAPISPAKLKGEKEKKYYKQLEEKLGNSKYRNIVSKATIAAMVRDAVSQRTEVNTDEFKAAKNVVVNAYGLYEIAKSGKDRKIQREIAEKAIAEVNEVTGKQITKADFQALMWYYEKELWSKLGLSKEIEKLDYEQAAEKVSQEYRSSKQGDQRELVYAGRRVSPETTGRAQSSIQSREDTGSSQQLDGGEFSRRRDGGRRASPRRRSESTGDRGGRDQGRKLAPLAGSPSVPGINGPDPRIVGVAERYARQNGIDLKRQAEYVQVDEDRARRIADAYEQMAHDPQDPKVKEAYENLIRQTTAQYRALEDAGYKFWFIDSSVPGNAEYASSPFNALRDLRNNQQMGVFPTNDGFGSSEEFNPDNNPLLADTGIMWPVGGLDGELRPVLANDLFRAVHDAFGHGLEGAGFRSRGEENAWQAHVRLFYGPAVGAITSETRGQNSWLNYGPHGEKNRTAKVEDTVFADQKTGLMPEWTWTEGRAADMEETGDEGVRYSPRRTSNSRWYLKSRDIVQDKMGPKATSEQVLGMLRKNGVNEEELYWSGLEELLGNKQSVTKDEVLAAIDSGINVAELQLPGKRDLNVEFFAQGEPGSWGNYTASSLTDRKLREGKYNVVVGDSLSPSTLTVHSDGKVTEVFKGETVEYANRNEADKAIRSKITTWASKFQVKEFPRYEKFVIPGGDSYGELLLIIPRVAPGEYRSDHWDDTNIVAHIRFNERTDADGKKVLFIEEVQSDWHQEGRKKGYIPTATSLVNEYRQLGLKAERVDAKRWRIINQEGEKVIQVFADNESSAFRKYAETTIKLARDQAGKVPDAPFKKTWPMLAMKRAVQYAAENGFDRIAWTTGDQQADRYDLSQQVKDIVYVPLADGYYAVSIGNKMGGIDDIDLSQAGPKLPNQDANRTWYKIPSDKLEDLVGKEIAEKIEAREGVTNPQKWESKPTGENLRVLSGEGLRVGGEGMKAFYDRILLNETNKLIKKFGAKVGKTTIKTPTFGTQGKRRVSEIDDGWAVELFDEDLGEWNEEETFETKHDAQSRIEEYKRSKEGLEVPSFDITSSMRDSALQRGQVLFSPSRRKKNDTLAELYKLLEEEGLIKPQTTTQQGEERTTSIKNRKTDELRAERGFPPRVRPARESFQDWEDEARREYPTAKDRLRLIGEAERNPVQVGKIESAAIGQHIADLENRFNAGENVLDELLRTIRVANLIGTEAGRALVSRKAERYSDFSLAGLIDQHIAAVGSDPSETQMQEYAELAEKNKKLEEENKKLVEELAKETIAREKAEAKPQPPKQGTKRAAAIKKVADAFSAFQNLWSGGSRPAAGRNVRPQAETSEFKKWFGDSKVVDKDGKPLVVYHGTTFTGDTLRPASATGVRSIIPRGLHTEGIWFSPSADFASEFSMGRPGGNANVRAVYLSIKNPARMGNREMQFVTAEELRRDGYDGAYDMETGSWTALDPEQIKSATGNRGTFDPNNPDIRYSPSRQPNDIKAAAKNVVSALREAGVSSILELESQIKANLVNASPEQIQAIRDAWNESVAKTEIESPIGDNPTDPELGARAKELMRAAIELGYGAEKENWMDVVDVVYEQLSNEVPGISKYETMQAMSDYGVWQELNKEPVEVIIRAIRGKARQSLKIEDTIAAIKQSEEWLKDGVSPEEVARRLREKGLLPKATGQERATPDSIERELISQFNKLKKTLPVPAESREGQLKSALSTAKTAANNRLEILDKDIAALDEAIKNRKELVKPVAEKTALEPDEELAGLREQLEQKRRVRDKLKADYEKIFPPTKPRKGRKPLTEEQRLDASVRMLERQISAVKADVKALEDGTWAPAAKNPELTSERKEELIAELRSLRQLRKVALEANPVYQATEELKYWQRYRKSQERRLAFWQRRLEEAKAGRIPVPMKKRTITEKAILEKNMEIEEVQYEAMVALEKAKRATWNTGQWIGQGLLEATSLIPKTLMLGMEMSFVLRQGFFYTYSQPMKSFYALMESIPAVFSQRLALEAEGGLKNRPNAEEYELAKVDFTKATGPQAKLEELYQSAIIRWLENTETKLLLPLRTWAKLYAMAERGNRTFSNIMKADMYDIQKRDTLAAREFFGVNTGWTEEDIKETGRIANIFSGRGTGLKGGNPWLDWLFLARRWTWSRIQADFIVPLQLVTPQWIGQWNADRGMRVALAKLYIQAMVGHTAKMAAAYVAYRLLAGDDEEEMPTFEFDLRSSDALAMKIGETRFKDEGGLMPAVVLASRLMTGQMKTSKGEIKSIYGDDVQYGGKTAVNLIFDFARYKLGPAPSAILEWISGRDAVGNVLSDKDDPTAIYRNIAGSRLTPLTYREIYAAESELGLKRGTLAALEAFFGVSVSTHGDRTKYKKATEEQRKKQFKKDLESMEYNTLDFAYKDLLTDSQRKQMLDTREMKKEAVVYAALASPPQRKNYKSEKTFEDGVADHEKAVANFGKMELDFNDARLMLSNYYKRQYGSAYEMRGGSYVMRESYAQRLQELRKLVRKP